MIQAILVTIEKTRGLHPETVLAMESIKEQLNPHLIIAARVDSQQDGVLVVRKNPTETGGSLARGILIRPLGSS